MTPEEFTGFYPQFAGFTPAAVFSEYISRANARFTAFTEADAEEARRLYVAHKLTLYAQAVPDGETAPGPARLADAGQVRPRITGKKVGEVSVTYAAGPSSSFPSYAGPAELAETSFGLQLLALIRTYGRSVYVP